MLAAATAQLAIRWAVALVGLVPVVGCYESVPSLLTAPDASPCSGRLEGQVGSANFADLDYTGRFGCPAEDCAIFGMCSVAKFADAATWCAQLSDADCAQSLECYEDGACKFHAPLSCGQLPPADCTKFRGCRHSGRCTKVGNFCWAMSESDCMKSEHCKTSGFCRLAPGGGCTVNQLADCLQSTGCLESGRCAYRNICEFSFGTNCEDLPACKLGGMCKSVQAKTQGDGGNRCTAASTEACAQSTWCKERGWCCRHPRLLTCVSGSAADCENSLECKTAGKCHYRPYWNRCVEPNWQAEALAGR